MAEQQRRPLIVVGIDGSDISIDALRWAVGQARLVGGEILAVLGWELPTAVWPAMVFDDVEFERDGAALVDRAAAAVGADAPDVTITTRVIRLQPRAALVEASQGADLLVVGSHGMGTLPGLHLGSVASYVAHHAACPVLVYRTAQTGR